MGDTVYQASGPWFRDQLVCQQCPNGSIPRERAMMHIIRQLAPRWEAMSIHESSPVYRGVSALLLQKAPKYIPTQFWPNVKPGDSFNNVRCENLEKQTFGDGVFDLVITQDVMEHVFHPDKVYQEVYRTLKPGGLYIHTTPIFKDRVPSARRAALNEKGEVVHISPPEYHGNPIDNSGSLVTFDFGYDLADLIAQWSDFDVEIRRFNDRTHGIVAEFSEVIVCTKRA